MIVKTEPLFGDLVSEEKSDEERPPFSDKATNIAMKKLTSACFVLTDAGKILKDAGDKKKLSDALANVRAIIARHNLIERELRMKQEEEERLAKKKARLKEEFTRSASEDEDNASRKLSSENMEAEGTTLPGSDFLKEAFLILQRTQPKVKDEKPSIMFGHILGNLRKLVTNRCVISKKDEPQYPDSNNIYSQCKQALSLLETINENVLFENSKEMGSFTQATRTITALLKKHEKDQGKEKFRLREEIRRGRYRRRSYSRSSSYERDYDRRRSPRRRRYAY